MTSSFANVPVSEPFLSHSVVADPPGANFSIGWSYSHNNPTISFGGILSTINDLAKLGLAILNSALMSPHICSRLNKTRHPYRQPELLQYNAGFTLLNAYYETPVGPQTRGASALKILDRILEALGDSTIVVSALNASAPGLVVQTWISNSIGVLASYFPSAPLRLQLAISNQNLGAATGEVTFQATQYKQWNAYAAANVGPITGFYDSDLGWVAYDGDRSSDEELRTFRFEVDAEGCAVDVTNAETRSTLKKEERSGVDDGYRRSSGRYILDGLRDV
ncbi:hypothetical protein LTR49_026454 [Elasticomyces elasticus]|nr:hypothetical protein LTR49_026454 [Elasticomyces elasticus]